MRLHKFDNLASMDDGETIAVIQGNAGGNLSVYRIEASYNPNAPSYEAEHSQSLMLNAIVLGVFALMSLI